MLGCKLSISRSSPYTTHTDSIIALLLLHLHMSCLNSSQDIPIIPKATLWSCSERNFVTDQIPYLLPNQWCQDSKTKANSISYNEHYGCAQLGILLVMLENERKRSSKTPQQLSKLTSLKVQIFSLVIINMVAKYVLAAIVSWWLNIETYNG